MSEECFFQSDDLEEALSLYKEENRGKIKKLSDFLDNIRTNRKYYRTGIQKNKKYKKEVTEDTNIIKTINSLINRTTLNNYDTIKPKIINLVNKDKEYIIPYIIESLIEKSILHHRYISLYVGIIDGIESVKKYTIINKLCDSYFNDFFNSSITSSDNSFYENLCVKNKNTDNIIGLSILITYLEKHKIINNYIEKVLDPFMKTINVIKDEIDIFKMLTSFYNISELYYDIIPGKYKEELNKLKNKTSSSKIKFKVMDILGE